MFQTQSGGGVVPQCQTSGASSGSQQKGVGVPALEKGRHSAEIRRQNGQRQRIFRMSREEGIANDEIARRLGISTRTVENQISRALSELRKLVTLILFFF